MLAYTVDKNLFYSISTRYTGCVIQQADRRQLLQGNHWWNNKSVKQKVVELSLLYHIEYTPIM